MDNESQVGQRCYEALWALANRFWSINAETRIPFISYFCPAPLVVKWYGKWSDVPKQTVPCITRPVSSIVQV
jgi:hypothetical protein